MSELVYRLAIDAFDLHWTDEERDTVKAFLRAHDVDPRDVPSGYGSTISVYRGEEGALYMRLQVYVRKDGDGPVLLCPTCPDCAQRREITRIVRTALPKVSTAWVAEGWAAIGVAPTSSQGTSWPAAADPKWSADDDPARHG